MSSNLKVLCRQDNLQILKSKDHPQNGLLSQFLSLPSSEREFLSELTLVEIRENEVLYEQGERIEFVYFPLDSVISGVSITEDGSTIETSLVGSDGLVGMSGLIDCDISQQWVWVTIGGSAIQLHRRFLDKFLVQNEAALKSFLKYYRLLLTHLAQRCVCNSKHTIMERLCCWLLMIHDRVGPRDLRLTQEIMASRIGVRRAGITVAARELQDMNAIDYRRGRLHIRSRKILEQLVCECYKVLAMQFEPNNGSAAQESVNVSRALTLMEKPLASLCSSEWP